MAVINSYYYLLTLSEAVLLYDDSATAFRYSKNNETFVNKTATDRKASKLGLTEILADKYQYTNAERVAIMEGEEWKSNSNSEQENQ